MKLESGLQFSLIVDNRDAAIAFYRDTLGLFLAEDGVLVFKYDPLFRMMTRPAQSEQEQNAIGKQAGDFPLFVLFVPDCRSLSEKLKSASVRFDGDLVLLPWGEQLTVFDPFGNRVCLATSVYSS